MNYKRIGRPLVCLVLICCLMVQTVPRADATGAGFAATITGVSSVAVSAPLVVGAMAIALGVMAGTNDDFQNLVQTAASSGFEWVKDGTVELLRTVDVLGNQAFYVAGEFLESLRQELFESGLLVDPLSQFSSQLLVNYEKCLNSFRSVFGIEPVDCLIVPAGSNAYTVILSRAPLFISGRTVTSTSAGTSVNFKVYDIRPDFYSPKDGVYSSFTISSNPIAHFLPSSGLSTPYDLSLGQIPTYSLDGTVQDDAFRDYMSKQIRFQNQENPDDPEGDETNSNWLVPLSLGAAASVFATTQAQQWLGQTSSDYDEYDNVAVYPDFRVDSKTDTGLDFDTIVIVPTGIPDSGGSSNPDDGGEDVIVPPDASFFEGLFGGLESNLDDIHVTLQEIPGLLRELFADIKTSIIELPSKFAEWFENIQTALQELIAGQITIGQLLGEFLSPLIEAFRTLLQSLFVPSSTFVSNKVDSIVAKYPHFNVFIGLGTQLKTFFLGLGSKPPIIYIDLGAATGSYFFGGRQAFIDLSWYADYKPTMDAILGAFIWLWLAWRIFLMLPGIINGSSGAAGSLVRYSERSMKSQDGGADR